MTATTTTDTDEVTAATYWAATVMDDLWRLSDETRIPACTILRATHQVFRWDCEGVR